MFIITLLRLKIYECRSKQVKKFVDYQKKQSESEQQFFDRFWEREQNKINVSELMRRKKSLSRIEEIDLSIMYWFRDKWLKNGGTSERISFYLWLESNYMGHLIEHQKHKKSHFSSSISRLKKQAKLTGLKQVGTVFLKIISLGFAGVLSYVSIKDIGEMFANIAEKSEGLDGAVGAIGVVGVVGVVIFFLCVFYFVGMFGKTEYGRQKNRLIDNKETWLRHQEAIVNYQKEMLDYIWELGDYNRTMLDENKDMMFMRNIKDVWSKNAGKFQDNMNKQKLIDEN